MRRRTAAHRPKPLRRYWLSGLMLFIGVGVTLAIGRSFLVQSKRLQGLATEAEAARLGLAAARAHNEALKQELVRLDTPAYIEMVARKELGLIKPGEIPYLALPKSEE